MLCTEEGFVDYIFLSTIGGEFVEGISQDLNCKLYTNHHHGSGIPHEAKTHARGHADRSLFSGMQSPCASTVVVISNIYTPTCSSAVFEE